MPAGYNDSFEESHRLSSNNNEHVLLAALKASTEDLGINKTSEMILADDDLQQEIVRLILSRAHKELKASLSSSKLSASKKSRDYLLTLTPSNLCEELKRMKILDFHLHSNQI